MSETNAPRLVVAGVNSGCGKTTIASGLMAALRHRGLKVQGFKVGPDYIDPSYHTIATGLPSRNLDSWMLEETTVVELFSRAAIKSDISIVEGVMGLFDGHSGTDDSGSTAQVAKILQAPVVLVLDVSKLSRSAAAVVLGCLHFDPELNIRGIILNKAGSERHALWVTEAIKQITPVPVLGYLPRNADIQLPERHLGLVPAAEQDRLERFFDNVRQLIEASIDIEKLIGIAKTAPPLKITASRVFPDTPAKKQVRIGIARDEAFSFYYQDNLDLLEAYGAELVFFSPLHDRELPAEIQGIYLGGGFPEMYARQLSENEAMRAAIKGAGLGGMAIYAECGGLMYVAEGIKDPADKKYPMVGLLPGWSEISGQRLKLAYVTLQGSARNPLARDNGILRGHEFHYSHFSLLTSRISHPSLQPAWHILEPSPGPEGYLLHNTLASYIHLHFAAHPSLAPGFVDWCSGASPFLQRGFEED